MPETQSPARPIRVLVAKPGLDGHDRGAKVVARAFRDAGMEVVYTGIRQTPEHDRRGRPPGRRRRHRPLRSSPAPTWSSFHASSKRSSSAASPPTKSCCFAGGIIPDDDIPALKQMGFKAIYGPGSDTREMIEFVRENVSAVA